MKENIVHVETWIRHCCSATECLEMYPIRTNILAILLVEYTYWQAEVTTELNRSLRNSLSTTIPTHRDFSPLLQDIAVVKGCMIRKICSTCT